MKIENFLKTNDLLYLHNLTVRRINDMPSTVTDYKENISIAYFNSLVEILNSRGYNVTITKKEIPDDIA